MSGLLFLFVITLIFLIFCYYANGKDILTPSVVVCGMFALSELFALLSVDTWGIDYAYEAAFILILGIGVFVAVDFFSCRFFRKRRIVLRKNNKKRKISENEGKLIYINRLVLALIILVNVAYIPIYYRSLLNLASASGLQGTLAVAMKSLSYDASRSAETNLGTMITLLGRFCMITGYALIYYYHHNKALIKKRPELKRYKRYNRMLLVPAICYLIASLFEGARIQILLFLVYYFTLSYISAQKVSARWSFKNSKKYIKYGVIALAVALPLFYLGVELLGRSNANLNMFNYLAIYIGGSIQHFNQYVQDPVSSAVWGGECFYSIYNFLWKLGLRSEYVVPHLEFRTLYNIGFSGDRWYSGNVYTFFRSPLSDFGIPGMVIMTLVFAAFYSVFYHNVIKKRNASEYVIILYAYLFAQLSMVSIANQLTIMISVYGLLNIAMFILMIYVVNRFCRRIVPGEVDGAFRSGGMKRRSNLARYDFEA